MSISKGASKIALVFGGCGALGRSVIQCFNKAGWQTVSVDFKANEVATQSITLSGQKGFVKEVTNLTKEITERKDFRHVDAVVNASGGWAGGSIGTEETLESVEKMLNFNLLSSVQAAHVASQVLKPNGLLVFTGATAALSATPTMIAYGISKAATHHLIKSLAADESSFSEGRTVVGVLPSTIDTPANRAAMPDADLGSWTKPSDIAKKVLEWTKDPSSRPASGSLVKVTTEEGETFWKKV